MGKYKMIDGKIRLGYELVKKGESSDACDAWLDAWEDIRNMLAEEGSKDIEILDKKFDWSEFMTNYIQDLEIELGNAGQTKEEYFKKRIKYCEEMLDVLNERHKLTIENTKRAIADSHYALGDRERCDVLYAEWLKEDPYWGWGYIGWSDCYGFGTDKISPDQIRAEEIIQIALKKENVRDKEDVLMRAAEVYEELDQIEKANELKKEMSRLTRQANALTKSAKIGRNVPCPCGSGIKYKKCCGKS